MTNNGWPPAEPLFDRDVPIDEGMFVNQRTLYSIEVRQVSPSRDVDAWTVQVDVVGSGTSRLTLCISTSVLKLYDRPERVAQHVLDVIRDWVELPVAERPGFLNVR